MNKISIIAVVIVAVVILGGGLYARDVKTNSPAPIPTAIPESQNGELQLQTFSVDELGDPLDETTLHDAVSRNDVRIEDEGEQIDEDISFLDEIKASASEAND
jgi:hypothetical protein